MRPINRIILHYTETPEYMDVSIEDVRKWHKERGFTDVGYHFLVRLDGSIELGRDIKIVGAHTSGANGDSIGIAYVGGLMNNVQCDTRNLKQRVSLDVLIGYLRRVYGDHLNVLGHNDFSGKVCPGFDARREYNDRD